MMKTVVVGGGGFVGSAIVDRFLTAGHSLRVLEHPGTVPHRKFHRQEKIEWVKGDFLVASDLRSALKGADLVVHLVSTTLPKTSNEDPAYDICSNITGTLRLLEVMVEQDIKRLLFASSGGTVYGNAQTLPIDENHPTEPLVSYGITKLAIEKYLALFERLHGITSIVLRLSNAYGERQRVERAQGAVTVFLDRARRDEPLDIWGDGRIIRDYVYVGDIAEAFLLAAGYAGSKRVFNIGSGIGTSVDQLVQALERAVGKTITRRYASGRKFDVEANILNVALAKQELGWAPAVSLSEGIVRTLRWLEQARPKVSQAPPRD
jgi:UDP-glucose 4-epimerase